MRSTYLISLILVIVVGITYWYQATANICPAPISYRLGEIDDSFGITKEEAHEYATKAERYWEEISGRELFVFDEEADFTIDFVFDERQASANSEETQREYLDKKWEESEEVRKTVENLQTEYKSLSLAYEAKVDAYEERLSEYNSEVNKYNDRGGAPADVFKKLEEERASLSKESERLNKTAKQLNEFASEINELSERGNQLVDSYNREVNSYNEKYGFAKEFTQGDYHGMSIRIYKFSSEPEVVTVLAHEFGHALGIGHVDEDESLMYYLLGDTDSYPVLSDEDVSAFIEICGENETLEQRIRKGIRSLLRLI